MFPRKENKEMSLDDIHTNYSDPKKAEKFFNDLKWPDGFKCEKCGCTHADYISKRKVYQCRECKH